MSTIVVVKWILENEQLFIPGLKLSMDKIVIHATSSNDLTPLGSTTSAELLVLIRGLHHSPFSPESDQAKLKHTINEEGGVQGRGVPARKLCERSCRKHCARDADRAKVPQ